MFDRAETFDVSGSDEVSKSAGRSSSSQKSSGESQSSDRVKIVGFHRDLLLIRLEELIQRNRAGEYYPSKDMEEAIAHLKAGLDKDKPVSLRKLKVVDPNFRLDGMVDYKNMKMHGNLVEDFLNEHEEKTNKEK